ncbi:hypothetical protein AB0X56_04345 [Weissella paramesenteroides]|uniref:hypothetical protein n=1 Tax=Weissella paramesenteroides TaxID=1249 RepID=UPI003F1FEBC5
MVIFIILTLIIIGVSVYTGCSYNWGFAIITGIGFEVMAILAGFIFATSNSVDYDQNTYEDKRYDTTITEEYKNWYGDENYSYLSKKTVVVYDTQFHAVVENMEAK